MFGSLGKQFSHKTRTAKYQIGEGPDDTRISVLLWYRDYVLPCHQLNEFKRLRSLRSPSIFTSEHIAANSSGKVVAK